MRGGRDYSFGQNLYKHCHAVESTASISAGPWCLSARHDGGGRVNAGAARRCRRQVSARNPDGVPSVDLALPAWRRDSFGVLRVGCRTRTRRSEGQPPLHRRRSGRATTSRRPRGLERRSWWPCTPFSELHGTRILKRCELGQIAVLGNDPGCDRPLSGLCPAGAYAGLSSAAPGLAGHQDIRLQGRNSCP